MDLAKLLESAHSLHMGGFNCAETVLWALSRYWGLEADVSVATGLGGGIARSGATCGAVLGAILAASRLVGRQEPDDEAGKARCYALGQRIMVGFARQMGATDCRDIIGFVLGSEGGAERYSQGGFKEGKCRTAVEAAITTAIQACAEEVAGRSR